ncbi:MAG: PQQ-binding-like beta-propeller repeat protein [Planctomycetaceae bacterium]|nr:PQQ-binding-like beta-propeller repeat protein [Planctomycetaceae bacterium]
MMKRSVDWMAGLCLIAVSSGWAAAGDWSQFRGPGTAGVSNETTAPVRWTASENLLWKTKLPGPGASCPIVQGKKVFLTCWSGYAVDLENPGPKADLRLHVVAFDRDTGELLWDRSQPASDSEQDITPRVHDHGYASPTPCADDSAVYAYFGVSGLHAYSHDGELLWKADCGSKTAGFGCAASPILFEDLVIQNASIESGSLYAFEKSSGRQVWVDKTIERAWTTPTLIPLEDGTVELVINHKDRVRGFNPRTGENLWFCSGIDDYVVPCVVGHEGVAYCLGGRQNRALAVRCGGRGDVTETHKLWEVRIGANVTSPVYYDGKLFWASDRGVFCCLNAKTGETLAQQRLPTGARLYASVVAVGDKLYVTTRDAGVVVLDAVPEYREVAVNRVEGDENLWNASPAVADHRLYFRTNGWLYAIGE